MSYIIPEHEVQKIRILVGNDSPIMQRRGLQLLVKHLEKGAIVGYSLRLQFINNLLDLIESNDDKVRRWVAISTSHLGALEVAIVLNEKLGREPNDENIAWFQAAYASCGFTSYRSLDMQSIGFAAALGVGSIYPNITANDLMKSDVLSRRGIGIALGYKRGRSQLGVQDGSLREIVQDLVKSDDDVSQEYGIWVQTRLLSYGSIPVSAIGIDEIRRLPANVRRWHARLLGKQLRLGIASESEVETVLKLSADTHAGVREGVALGVVGWCPSRESALRFVAWFSQEPEREVRVALLEHMSLCHIDIYDDLISQEIVHGNEQDIDHKIIAIPTITTQNTHHIANYNKKIVKDENLLRVDVAIVTALPIEYSAVKLVIEREYSDNVHNIKGKITNKNYKQYLLTHDSDGCRVVLPEASGMGTNMAAIRAAQVLIDFPEVKYIILSGIAGGSPDHHDPDRDVRLGDVVISSAAGVIQYDHHKNEAVLVEHEPAERSDKSSSQIDLMAKITPRHPPRPPSSRLLAAAIELERRQAFENDHSWSEVLRDNKLPKWSTRPNSNINANNELINYPLENPWFNKGFSNLHIGAIGSGNILLRNSELRDYVRDKYGIMAVEMEGSGVADAVWDSEIAGGYLIVRGIQDYCDENKGDAWRGYASIAAAVATIAIVHQTFE